MDGPTAELHPDAARLLALPCIEQRTPAWYAARRDLLTASDVAGALGIKPYASWRPPPGVATRREDTMLKKLDDAPLWSAAADHGTFFEDEARAAYDAAHGETTHEVGLVVHPTEPWLAASPDGVTSSGKLVEIKCPLGREIVRGEVPAHYLPQVQVQMAVCGARETAFVQYVPACLRADGRPFLDVAVVQRDAEWFARHRDALHAFWAEYVRRRDAHVPRPRPPDACSVCLDLYDDCFD